METYLPPEMDGLALTRENNRLLRENNELLKKINRRDIQGIWIKVIWFALLIGLPIIFYSYIMDSYMSALGLTTSDSAISADMTDPEKNAEELLRLLKSGQ